MLQVQRNGSTRQSDTIEGIKAMADKGNKKQEEHDNEGHSHRSETYGSARSTFEELGLEEKAMFLFESAVATVVGGLQRFGEQMEQTFRDACNAEGDDVDHADDAAEGKENHDTSARKKSTGKTATKSKAAAKGKPRSKKPAAKKAGSSKKTGTSGDTGKSATDKES